MGIAPLPTGWFPPLCDPSVCEGSVAVLVPIVPTSVLTVKNPLVPVASAPVATGDAVPAKVRNVAETMAGAGTDAPVAKVRNVAETMAGTVAGVAGYQIIIINREEWSEENEDDTHCYLEAQHRRHHYSE
jgi:hypothetical protein